MALLPTPRPNWRLQVGALLCLLWPMALDGMERWSAGRGSDAVRRDLHVHLAECGLTGLLAGWLWLPALPLVVVATVLLTSNAAQAGWWLAWRGALAFGLGVLGGMSVGARFMVGSTAQADLISAALLLSYCVGLGLSSFLTAQRLHSTRSDLRRRTLMLDQLNRRLGRYLPAPVQSIIEREPERPCALHRRWLTIAFVDVVGFTELAARLAPEELAAIVNDYYSAATRHFEDDGGIMARLQGDGVLAYFGADEGSRQHAAQRCVEACRRVWGLLEWLAEGWHRQGYVVKLAARVGVASGYCTLGDWGDERLDFTVIGSPVNLANRLQALAPSGSVLVCESTAALIRESVVCGGPLKLQVKGLDCTIAHEVPFLDPSQGSAIVPPPKS